MLKLVFEQSVEDLVVRLFKLEHIKFKLFVRFRQSCHDLHVSAVSRGRHIATQSKDLEEVMRRLEAENVYTDKHKHHLIRYAKFYHSFKPTFKSFNSEDLTCISRRLTFAELTWLRMKFKKRRN